MMRARVGVAMAVVLLVTGACIHMPARSQGFACSQAADCGEGRTCLEGWCVAIGDGTAATTGDSAMGDIPGTDPMPGDNGDGGGISDNDSGLANGLPCDQDSQCASNECECASPKCATKVCSEVSCPCTFNRNGDATCGDDIDRGWDDANNTCGTLSCNGHGGCALADGSACTKKWNCETNICDCSNADCTATVCASNECDCQYDAGGDGTCDGPLLAGISDAGVCDGGATCDGDGTCALVMDGDACSKDRGCQSSNCECTNGGCTMRVCTTINCICSVYDSSAGTCTGGVLNDEVDDPDDDCEDDWTCVGGTCVENP